ncbi:hypothetical protein NUW58_g8652 [Xylaria curta]|uniref:Uncharacterized protein n=1 Tax=Xylaria curta TaxID=42375 RepID=A0ACC1N7J8_9PEZI|nr:hypothetical protein NUW58_g8652 [Xylaria curta]
MATAAVDQVPSSQRLVPGSFNIPLAPWPTTEAIDGKSTDTTAISSKIIDSFNQSLEKKDYQSVADLFVDNGYWRDQLALTWDLRTAKGKDKIINILQAGHHLVSVNIDNSSAGGGPQVVDLRYDSSVRGILFFTTVTTQFGSGRGVVRLIQESGKWKIWTFFTMVEKLKGHEEAIGPNRPSGVQHGVQAGRKNWVERRQAESNFENSEPEVLIVGSGQAGLSVNARLKMLNVPTLAIDRADDIGDAWRNRYHQLVLHDPICTRLTLYHEVPYLKFPDSWPIFTPKDKMADFLKSYAHMLELNVWTKTELESSTWDDDKKQWTVILKRKHSDGSTETRTFHPKHIIQTTGHSGKKDYPTFKGADSFKGDVLCHSSDFRGAKKNTDGRKAVIIGSCNSALDIAQDYYENGYDVTIIQRSTTTVISSNAILKLLFGAEVAKAMHVDVNMLQQDFDKELLEGLNKAGFKTDRGPMNAGLFFKYFQRGGGYYIDVGASQLIIDGKVKVKGGQGVDEILPHGVRLDDGTELQADEIICATGYQNMKTVTESVFGIDVASRVGDVWGFDEEGEPRVMWRQSGHPGLWLHGGNLAMCRYFSRIVALQIKARLEGLTS